MQLSDPTTALPGVGPALAALLSKCGIRTIQDLLFHLPYRYQDRTRVTPIRDLRDHEWAVVEGIIIRQEEKFARRRQLLCYLQDQTHLLRLRFFHYSPGFKQSLQEHHQIRVFGEARFISGQFEMVHPEFNVVAEGTEPSMEEYLTPIYTTTQKLSQKKLRQLVQQALALLDKEDVELLPESYLNQESLPSLKQSLHFLHAPPPDAPIQLIEEGLHPCQQRLALEELLSHHLSFKRIRLQLHQKQAEPLPLAASLKERFLQQLPFELTHAQQRVVTEIEHDLAKAHPMYRLIQGDVGSGKTLVAALASLPCLNAKGQVAVMAPTELLAEQLHRNFQHWFAPLGYEVGLLLGKQTKKQRELLLEKIAANETAIVVGTHALFQQSILFKQLQLIIIDEQHRFGVKQRLALQEKGHTDGQWPHQLVMTATPIPRTLAMAQYATLDVSIIDELPPGRTPIQTAVLDQNKRVLLIERLAQAFKQNKQAYWVCTLIEESEVLQCQAAEETKQQLEVALPHVRIGLVHGRMKAKEKHAMMAAFLAHELDLLVATTVIEVGVDVPNATLMIIENAERLGLAQLHQLRGRVGRGSEQSHCLLLYQPPLSNQSRQRLHAIRASTDGFVIAEEDLKLRGAGEIIGTKQTGLIQMKIANIKQHHHLLAKVPLLAKVLAQNTPTQIPLLINRWLGDGERYVQS